MIKQLQLGMATVAVLMTTIFWCQRNSFATTISLGAGTHAGPWALDAANNTFTLTGTLASPVVLDGVISESFVGANLLLTTPNSSNAVRIATVNQVGTYTGNTTVRSNNARGGFRIGVDNALPTGTVLTLEGTNVGSGRPVWFDLNGHSQQLAGIAHATRTDGAIVNGDDSNDGALIIENTTNVVYQAFLGPDNAHGNITQGIPGSTDTGIPEGEGNNFSLTKKGGGALTLTRANSYTGDTTIDQGTLSIQNAYLADTASVFVANGATLDLNFAGTDTIEELWLNGAPMAIGEWGSTASGAANVNDVFFTGSGTLTVTAVPEPSTLCLAACGLLGLVGCGRRRKRS
jgi:autotransporter-associated beta strand protein